MRLQEAQRRFLVFIEQDLLQLDELRLAQR